MIVRGRLRRLFRRSGPTSTGGAPVRFSIVLPIYDSPLDHLRTQLESISAQTYPHWECVVVDDGSTATDGFELALRMSESDPRIVVHRRAANGGIAAATNDGLDRASGDWIVFCDHDDVLYPHALATIAGHIATHPRDDLIYSDEELIDHDGSLIHQHNKPDFSPERFLANNYLCHLVAMRHAIVDDIGRLVSTYEPSADRDFNMRASIAARSVGHIPEVLYGWRAIPGSVAKAIDEKPHVAESVLVTARAHIDRLGETATASILPGGEAMVRITWPTVDGQIDELVQRLVLDESSTAEEIGRRIADGSEPFVALCPSAVDPEQTDWLSPLMSQCARPGVGACGPLVVTSDGRLVSAGRVHHPSTIDLFQGIDGGNHGPWGAFLVSREVASVSPLGAVFDRRAVLDVGGFDLDQLLARAESGHPTRPGLDVLDGLDGDAVIDITTAMLCTALRLAGMSTIWTPQSTLTLPPTALFSATQLEQRRIVHETITAVFPRLAEDPFSPIGVHRI
jgi:hypothetical protein